MTVVSVITPSYNSAKYIASTIESVIFQSFQEWELLVIDDCSTDNSIDIINSYRQNDSRIKLIKLTENGGAAVARNKGIEAARGRYIAFLDSDDTWHPSKLEKQIDFMLVNNYSFTYTAYNKVDSTGHVVSNVGIPDKVSYTDLLKKCEIGCLTAIYDSKNLGKIYMPLIRKRQDLGLWLRILKSTPFAYGYNDILASYTVRNDSISSNKLKAASYTWKLYRNVEKLPMFKATYYFSHYAINGVLRTKFPSLAKALGAMK